MSLDRPKLLIYANCQSNSMFKAMSMLECLRDHIDVRYLFIHSLEEPGSGWDTYPDDYCDNVICVWEQMSEAFPKPREELHRRLPKGVRRIRFPALTGSVIWPFFATDPRPTSRRLFLYGDSVAARIGIRLAGKNVSDDDIMTEYLTVSARQIPMLDRRLELESDAWAKRDVESDVSAARYVAENLRERQLFYEPGRITNDPQIYLLRNLLTVMFDDDPSLRIDSISEAEQLLKYQTGQDAFSIPVHPLVAQWLKLRWYDPDARYRWFSHDWTFREWIVRCVRLTPYVANLF